MQVGGMSAPSALERTLPINALKEPNLMPNLEKNPYQNAQTPVRLQRLLTWLECHPDRAMAKLLHDGFQVGFEVPKDPGPGCSWYQSI